MQAAKLQQSISMLQPEVGADTNNVKSYVPIHVLFDKHLTDSLQEAVIKTSSQPHPPSP